MAYGYRSHEQEHRFGCVLLRRKIEDTQAMIAHIEARADLSDELRKQAIVCLYELIDQYETDFNAGRAAEYLP